MVFSRSIIDAFYSRRFAYQMKRARLRNSKQWRNVNHEKSSSFILTARLPIFSGILLFLAYPGVDLWPLGVCCLVPLFRTLRTVSAGLALTIGWITGFVSVASSIHWLVPAISRFSETSFALSLGVVIGIAGFEAFRYGIAAWLCKRAIECGWRFDIATVLSFSSIEAVFPSLIPWYLGCITHELTPFVQIAELAGPVGVSALVAFINVMIDELFELHNRRARLRVLALLFVTPFIVVLYGKYRIQEVNALVNNAENIRVGIVQANMKPEEKRYNATTGLFRHVDLTRSLRGRVDLAVWSETAVVGATDKNDANSILYRAFTKYLGTSTLFGAVLSGKESASVWYYNAALISDVSGEIRGVYNKQHLIPFGERLQIAERFPVLYKWLPSLGRFRPGDRAQSLPYGRHRITALICYEDLLPSFVAKMVQEQKSELLINLTNDAWFGDTAAPWIHLALSKFRAVENRRFLVRATNNAVSAVIDPMGRTIAEAKPFTQTVLRADVAWLNVATPFHRIGNTIWWLAFAILCAMGVFRRLDPRKCRPITPSLHL